MIVHQAIGVTAPALLPDFLAEQIKKRDAVLIVGEDIGASVAACCQVIKRTCEFKSKGGEPSARS